jgi:hypothetical protein
MSAHKSGTHKGSLLKKIGVALLVIPFSPIILLVHAMKKHGKGEKDDKTSTDSPPNDRGTYGRR